MRETAQRVALSTLVVIAIVAVALAVWIVVPRAVDQVQNALGGTTQAQIHREATQSKGIKHDILTAIDKRLREVPKASDLLDPAVQVTLKVFEVLLGIFF